MLTIQFQFSKKSTNLDKLSGFDLGYIEIKGTDGVVSSESRIPDQAMMLIPSVVLLLDGLREFLSSCREQYVFTGIDCSFSVSFSAEGSGLISISIENKCVERADKLSLKNDIQSSVGDFVGFVTKRISPPDAATCDLIASYNDFVSFTP